MRTTQETTTDEHGNEVHPAFATIGASRVQSTGTVLFDSDVQHQQFISIRIHSASRKRDLNRDWIHPEKFYVELDLSEAQWASFVSSMNVGSGVPCTLRYFAGEVIPEFPHDPRLAHSIKEATGAARAAFDQIRAAMADYEALGPKATAAQKREAMRRLRASIDNAGSNVEFAGKSLVEMTENVVQKARADIEAFVVTKAHQLGLDPASVGTPLALGGGLDD